MSSDPTLTLSTPNPVILDDDISIKGTIDTADADEQIGIYDGDTLLKTVTANANGIWSTTIALPEAATYSLTAKATNATGTGTSAALTLDAFTFSQADLNEAQVLASDIDAASPSAVETISSAGPTTISSSASYVIDTAAVPNTIDATDQGVIVGDGGTTIDLTGLSTSPSANGPHVLVALASGAATIPGTSYSNIVEVDESITAVIDGDASTLVLNEGGVSTIVLTGSGGTVENFGYNATISGASGVYNIVSTNDTTNLLVTADSGGAYNVDYGNESTSVYGDAGSYFALSANTQAQSVTVVAGGGEETFNAANDAAGAFFVGGVGSADFIGASGFNLFSVGTGDELMVAGSSLNMFDFALSNGSASGYYVGSVYTIENFSSQDSLQFSGNSYNVGAYALEYQKVVNGDLVLPLGDGAEIIIEGRTTPLSSSQVKDSDGNRTPPSAPTIAAPPTPLSVTGAAVAAIDGNASHTTGTINASDTVTLTLSFSADAFITGNPTLQLNDGGAATYVSGSGGTTLTFAYTPMSGQNTSTLASTGLANGAIQDAYGNAAADIAQTFNGLSVETTPVCYFAGTRILTERGEVAVETLKPGDIVLTSDGRRVAVSWLGVQTVSTRFADPLRVLPIRIKAGALTENTPSRDLLLSPGHAVLIGDALYQAGALVNGSSIVREANVPEVFSYYHVEVDGHELILAENTPAETFVDNVERLHFDNWAAHEALYPEGKVINELPYPRAKSHRQTPMRVRAHLAERASAMAGAGTAA